MRTEPPPSVPWAMGPMPTATATPAPPLEPPAIRSGFQGLAQGGPSVLLVKAARPNSGVLVLPSKTAPASRRRSQRIESVVATLFA